MFKKIKGLFRLLKKFPILGSELERISIQRQFRVERALINGTHANNNKHESILHFSINKAATQYVKSILRRCAIHNGMTHADINGYAFFSDFPYLDHLSESELNSYKHIFRQKGYLYSVLGGMMEGIPGMNDYLIVLTIRDPRDVLTSGYYSKAYSHPAPFKKSNKYQRFIDERANTRCIEIDEYVINQSERVRSIYQGYIDHLLTNNNINIYCAKYEEMISDFPAWLDNLLRFCELKINPRLHQKLIDESIIVRPRRENVYKHLRQATPGDHRRKLKPATIDILNSTFSGILNKFGYD